MNDTKCFQFKGKEDERSNKAEQTCFILRIVGNSNKLVYLTPRIKTLSSTLLHYIFIALSQTKPAHL